MSPSARREEGKRLGRQFGHDAFALARHLGLPVEYVNPGAIDNPKRPTMAIVGRFVNLGDHPFIQVVAGLSGRELHWTVAHECGHALGFSDEGLCEQFADRFLRVENDERPGLATAIAVPEGRSEAFWRDIVRGGFTHSAIAQQHYRAMRYVSGESPASEFAMDRATCWRYWQRQQHEAACRANAALARR